MTRLLCCAALWTLPALLLAQAPPEGKKPDADPAASSKPLEDRPPPIFGYTQRLELDGIPILTFPMRKANGKHDLVADSLSGVEYVFRFGGGRVSRFHFLPYAGSLAALPFTATVDGQIPDERWGAVVNSKAYVVLLRREAAPVRWGKEPKYPAPLDLAYLTIAKGGEAEVVRVRLAEKREGMPNEALPNARETPEGREKITLKPATTRVPLKLAQAARTLKGASVDLEALAKKAASGPVVVGVLPEGQQELDAFWRLVINPEAILLVGLPESAKK